MKYNFLNICRIYFVKFLIPLKTNSNKIIHSIILHLNSFMFVNAIILMHFKDKTIKYLRV